MADAQTVSMEQYKNLQRELDKSRKKLQETNETRMRTDRLEATVSRLEELLDTVADGLVKGGALDDADELGKRLSGVKEKRGADKQMLDIRERIGQLLDDSDFSWSDPELADARKAYDSGKFDDAVSVVRKLVGEDGDFDARVAAAVQKKLKEVGKVDTGESTAVSGIPTDAKGLREKMKDPDWWKANKAEVMKKAKRGELLPS